MCITPNTFYIVLEGSQSLSDRAIPALYQSSTVPLIKGTSRMVIKCLRSSSAYSGTFTIFILFPFLSA